MSLNIDRNGKKRVVIVGGGFGGLKLANKLRHSGMQIILIDKNDYHQFQPLIYQVASAGMEPSSISFPFRRIFKKNRNIYFRMAEVRSVFPDKKIIQTSIGKVDYDYLVLAAGATTNYYGNKHIAEEAMPMKNVSEAMGLQNAILANLERAITCATDLERQELLNFVIVGGGATGVEVAGVLSEMKKSVIPHDYPELDHSLINIYLIEASSKLLSAMSPEASQKAERFLRRMGVNILLNKRVMDYKNYKVLLQDGSEIATRTFIWVSGIAGVSIGNMDPSMIGHGGRIKVDEFNRIPGMDNVFAIGDQCIMSGDESYPKGHPQLAQVAIQQGQLLAKNICRLEKGKEMKSFHYKNLGSMATVGRNKAVADFKTVKIQGFFAWVLWLVVHLRSILGVRNKAVVLLNWVWNYFNYNQSLRMIFYPKKAKVEKEREAREAVTHWGEDLIKEEEETKATVNGGN
ncbi:MAG: NAD(P)/FAD-dependent oxidoreductase [Prevotella sp.]|jgi:NADH dehydrogenase|nr:NAD(P)/FAD-dependent oxidoreductase [Prevotella sp.]MCH4018285.1 NAD(P)/FAD-dependent oxidoreductase [Prevotella sp.]MCH4100603.1 NAD(P)/FAD-dependent oxidoreductase [Prevotella sp.]MCI1350250.1 NAD(P)/FAD-dependent oxidoreductase [Prevotella sp.]MCI1416346.1 NAD(P)/FAD-dependent oxidoreductase [Prevotella sp.]